MTIQQCIDASLQLINQYSIVGTIVPTTYNDQQDDITRTINLINDAMMEIATNARPLIETVEFVVEKPDRKEPLGDVRFSMPENFDRATAVRFTPAYGYDRTMREASDYKWLGDDTLLVPNKYPGTYLVEYMRYPVQFTLETEREHTQLDNTPDTHSIIPYYVAAMVTQYDDAKAYYNLYNIWEERLAKLGYKYPHATTENIVNVYGVF